jgi:putative ABC transport system ATP-binding protein
MNILEIKGLKKVYGTGEARVEALKGIDMQVERGEFVAVVGTSGSGKTTFLNMVGALDVPTEGQILDGKELGRLTDDELTVFRRRKIGFIFQQYNLIPMLNVWENIILPLKMDGKRVDKDYLDELIKILGLEEKKKSRPDKLSGGQQQRVAIARALAIKPSLLLADEPTGNLDSRTSQDVLGLLKITGTRFHQTILMITHNEEIAQMADRIVRIEDGRLVKDR